MNIEKKDKNGRQKGIGKNLNKQGNGDLCKEYTNKQQNPEAPDIRPGASSLASA